MGSQLVPRLLAGHTNNARYRTLVRVDGQNCSLGANFFRRDTTDQATQGWAPVARIGWVIVVAVIALALWLGVW
jgi:hypothetical protein